MSKLCSRAGRETTSPLQAVSHSNSAEWQKVIEFQNVPKARQSAACDLSSVPWALMVLCELLMAAAVVLKAPLLHSPGVAGALCHRYGCDALCCCRS